MLQSQTWLYMCDTFLEHLARVREACASAVMSPSGDKCQLAPTHFVDKESTSSDSGSFCPKSHQLLWLFPVLRTLHVKFAAVSVLSPRKEEFYLLLDFPSATEYVKPLNSISTCRLFFRYEKFVPWFWAESLCTFFRRGIDLVFSSSLPSSPFLMGTCTCTDNSSAMFQLCATDLEQVDSISAEKMQKRDFTLPTSLPLPSFSKEISSVELLDSSASK